MNREMEIEKGWDKDGINNILKCQLDIPYHDFLRSLDNILRNEIRAMHSS